MFLLVRIVIEGIFVKPQQWPTPSESIAIYCVRKLVSCVTHLQSCAKVDILNKKKKLRTVAKIKTQDYKNRRLQNLSTIVTPPLNTATTLFNEHRSQRPLTALLTDKTYSPRFAWSLSQVITWFATDRNVQRKKSTLVISCGTVKKFTLQLRYNKLFRFFHAKNFKQQFVSYSLSLKVF